MPDYETGFPLRRTRTRLSTDKVVAMPLHADIDPAPTPWPFAPALAVAAVLFFISVQLILPVTHIRHPLDPHRHWIPINQIRAQTYNEEIVSNISDIWSTAKKSNEILIVVKSKETDLRPIIVALNSTISNTMEPEELDFCVILPSSVPKSEYLKLNVVFSEFDIKIIRDEFIMDEMRTFMPSERSSKLLDVVPYYLPMLFPSYERFVYLESDAVLQGDIADLIGLDMQGNPVAGVLDCTQDFETFFSMSLLEAARLSSGNGKPQLPLQPYEPKTCLLDKATLVVDKIVWKNSNVTEAVHWWTAMHYKTAETLYSNGRVELPLQLALYQKYEELDTLWSVREPLTFAKASAAKLIHYDKEHKPWHHSKQTNFEKDVTMFWWKYLSPSVNMIFSSH